MWARRTVAVQVDADVTLASGTNQRWASLEPSGFEGLFIALGLWAGVVIGF